MDSAPRPYELIQSLQDKINELELAIHNQRTKVTPLKIGKVNPFKGKRGTLKTYLAQTQLYLANNLGKFMSEADKVLAVASFLEGDAMNWFDGYLTDWFENADHRYTDTVYIFAEYDNFVEKLKMVFGNINEENEARHKMNNIRQFGLQPTSTGTMKLLRTSSTRRSRKSNIATDGIDQKLYAVRMEQQQWNSVKKPNNWNRNPQKDRDGDTVMQLNATLSKEEKEERQKKGACYNCGKPVKQHRKSRDELKVEQEFVTKFLQAGYIRESKSKLSAKALFVPKKDGSPRMVIDCRRLNNATEDDAD
ncbi:hypothetical protein V1525DRAFT_458924 [Lipomyces kononenkoae]|uniref:Uncharacterized protein n=1 Tax=Lipomyces kononenkoae TaxID=34357 RepID=A0ACC3STP5_LIPKO